MLPALRLGVNVDHVATLRQARGTPYPDPVQAAMLCAKAGADSITVHLREDRRHIQPTDVRMLCLRSPVPINLEMAVTEEMIEFACAVKPKYVCLVPEKREERTTEGGLNVAGQIHRVTNACRRLAAAGIEVSLFIEPDIAQLESYRDTGAPHLEIHTGRYADVIHFEASAIEYVEIANFAAAAHAAGFEVHAGHGLHLENVAAIAALPEIVELNIGHAIVARSVFVGIEAAVREMRAAMDEGRARLIESG